MKCVRLVLIISYVAQKEVKCLHTDYEIIPNINYILLVDFASSRFWKRTESISFPHVSHATVMGKLEPRWD